MGFWLQILGSVVRQLRFLRSNRRWLMGGGRSRETECHVALASPGRWYLRKLRSKRCLPLE